MPNPDETLPATEGQEESQEQQMADTPEEGATAISDSTATPAESQAKTSEFDWSTYKGAERLAGRSVQDVIDYLNIRDRQFGDQANEIGRLRELAREHEKLKQQITGQPQKEKKREFSNVEMAVFANEFNENPLKALEEHFAPRIVDNLADQIYQKVSERISPEMEDRAQGVATQYEYSQCVANHPEIETDPQLRYVMYRLTGDDYVGPNVPFEQVYQLAILGRDEPSLFGTTCELMRKGLSFGQAKEFASLKQNSAVNAEQTKEGIKKEVAGLRGGAKRPTKNQATSEPEINNMDDAFNIPE